MEPTELTRDSSNYEVNQASRASKDEVHGAD
jgi:hypothetical protein